MSKQVSIELSVKVSDDSYAASLVVPVTASRSQFDTIVQGWLGALRSAMELSGVGEIDKCTPKETL